MSCLLCLRNEGIHLPNENSNEFQILLQLFSLPEEFSQYLEGNKCCSLCRVKLQFVQVLNEEISILSEKVKCFEKEVKGIFVSSFKENYIANSEKIASQARMKLFKELNIFNPEVSTIEIPLKIEIDPSEMFQNEEAEFTNEDPLSNHEPEFITADCQEFVEDLEEDEMISSDESIVFLPTSSTSLNSSKIRRSQRNKKVAKTNEPFFKKANNNLRNYKKFRKYVCSMCPTKTNFTENAEYENHLANFHPTRQYSTCTICTRIILEDENFSESHTRGKLKDHMQVHTGIRPFPCDLCDLSFKRKHSMKIHRETHLKREEFTCELCGKISKGYKNMNNHLRTTHGSWNFNCPYCGIKARTEGGPNFKQHLANCEERKTRK